MNELDIMRGGWCTLVSLAILLAGGLRAGQAPAAETAKRPTANARVDFSRDIEPIFKTRCHACHGPRQQMNGLRLDLREDALRGSNSGPVILPGNSGESKLIHMVTGLKEGLVMPPVGPRLTDQQIALLRAWIDQGAEWPATEAAAVPSQGKRQSGHWAFQPLTRPNPPAVLKRSWIRNPIDNFVLARLEADGIDPSPEAPKATLIRRLSLDLVGLPPAPEEVAAFLTDNRPDAYERLVDRLLASPHYGEKWARHWLDQARYADSDGYEKDLPRPYAWRYRNWVIDALNRDMAFDEFTIDQIAGDLLPNATVEQKVATGFHRNTLTNREGGVDIEQFRFEEVVDRANTVGTVWLGLTVGCAQCHDHKYDPIKQKDYYRFFAFFNNAEEAHIDAPLPGEWGPYLRTHAEYLAKRQDLLNQYRVPELQADWEKNLLEAVAHPGKRTDWDLNYDTLQKMSDGGDRILKKDPAKRSFHEQEILTNYFLQFSTQVFSKERYQELGFKNLREKLAALKESYPQLSRARVVFENPDPRKSYLHIRGDYSRRGIEVQPGTPEFLPPLGTDSKPTRLSLARWLVSPGNPLTARVIVNRMWQYLFGRGLVATSEDFGTQGEKPSHPELLDWLAAQFMDCGWRMKRMHKLIVMSAAYRQSSHARPELLSRDPNNALLARQNRVRLPAELIRDSVLAASGLLSPRIGGPSVHPYQPKGVAELGYANSIKWKESQGEDRYRRGLYIHFQRTVPYPFLVNFDAPNAEATACRRDRSDTPLQALNLLNDPVFFEAAQALAARIIRESPTSRFSDRLDYAFALCLARKPKAGEQEQMLDYFHKQMTMLERDSQAVEHLSPAALEGVDRIETAAWVGLSRILLNLDEFITRE